MQDKIRISAKEKRPQVVICGNGIERGFGQDSWEKVIKRILKENDSKYMYDDIKDLPANMQIVIASSNKVDDEMAKLKKRLMEYIVSGEHKEIYKQLNEVGADVILTTNYDFNIEQALGCENKEHSFQKIRRWTQSVSENMKKYHLFQYSQVNEESKPIWHIHGDLCNKESMIMGHFFYGKLLAQVEKRANDFVRWYKAANTKNADVFADSWVDLFLTGDLYIVGLQMYLTEIDLWWLIDYKYKVFPESKIYYYQPAGYVDKDIRKMLEIYPRVTIVDTIALPQEKEDSSKFKDYYKIALDNIKKRIDDIREN